MDVNARFDNFDAVIASRAGGLVARIRVDVRQSLRPWTRSQNATGYSITCDAAWDRLFLGAIKIARGGIAVRRGQLPCLEPDG